jgi:endoglucanase
MKQRIRESLARLLDAPGPSGFEAEVASEWRSIAETFAHRTWGDVQGNSFAEINPEGSPRVILAGHVDEIGLIVHHIDDDGFLFVKGIGGWDTHVLVGQRVQVLTESGPILGVVGRKAVHIIGREESEKAVRLKDLWIDIGAADGEDARKKVEIGDVAVIRSDTVELAGGLIAARSIDDRAGAVVVLEALRLAAENGTTANVIAVATVQEEIGYLAGGGARTGAYGLDPKVAIVVDVTHATDHPTIDRAEYGNIRLGGGPVLTRGAAINPVVYRKLRDAADGEGVEVQIQASPALTGTDADAIRMSRAGVATGIVSIPNRYMHTPNQIVATEDLEKSAKLIAAMLKELDDGDSFLPV